MADRLLEFAVLPAENDRTRLGWPLAFAVVVAVALLAQAPLLLGGRIVEGVDTRTHFQWAWQFADALRQGDLKPTWSHLANEGLGQPVFIVGQMLYLYLVGALHLAGVDLWQAMRAVSASSTVAVGLVAVLALRGLCSRWVTLAVAVVLQCLPFLAFLLGFHVAITSHFATPLALAVLALSTLHRRPGPDMRLTLGVALLAVTHVLVAFMTLLTLALVLAWRLIPAATRRHRWREAWAWALSVGLGLGLAAAFLLMGLSSMGYMQGLLDPNDRYLDWRNSFLFPLLSSQFHGSRWTAIQWLLPIPSVAILAVGVGLLWRLRGAWPGDTRQHAGVLLAVTGVALFLGSELSYPLYQALGVLRSVQWPYRFLAVASLVSALALAPLACAAQAQRSRAALLLVVLSGLTSLAMFAAVIAKQQFEVGAPRFGPHLLEGRFGQKGADPVTAGPRWREYLDRGSLDGYCARASFTCRTLARSSKRHAWEVDAGASGRVVLPLFSFPAWGVTVNGAPVAAGVDTDTGLLAVALQSGRSRIDVTWQPLWQERAGAWITLVSMLVVAALAWRQWRAPAPPRRPAA